MLLKADYLSNKEKVVMANSKNEFVEAESSKLRKDLIETMDETNKVKVKIEELNEALRVEKMLVIQKDKDIQATLLRTDFEREKIIQQFIKSKHFSDLQFIQYYKGFELLHRWIMKHHNHAVDFSILDYETIDTEIIPDKAREQAEASARGEDATDVGRADPGQRDEVVAPPS